MKLTLSGYHVISLITFTFYWKGDSGKKKKEETKKDKKKEAAPQASGGQKVTR